MTYRERRERRAERLQEWAGKREQRSTESFEHAHQMVAMIPLGQPIHGQADRNRRERSWVAMDRSLADMRKGEEMASRATEIERQLATSIYDDDPDAIERLEAKLATLEAERDRVKAYNASCRKAVKTGGAGDLSLLDGKQRTDIASTIRVGFAGTNGAFPAYELSSLGQRIREARQRIERLKREREHGPSDRYITARFDSECADCGAPLTKGDLIRYNKQQGARCYPQCATEVK